MKHVLIVSDSHGVNENIRAALDKAKKKYGKIDMMFHLGDVGNNVTEVENMAGVSTYIVAGNTDYYPGLKQQVIIGVDGHHVLGVHGHRESVHFGLDTLRYKALENGCDIAMFGHIHTPVLDEGDVTIINPGSISLPRQADKKKTFAVMITHDDGSITVEFDSIN